MHARTDPPRPRARGTSAASRVFVARQAAGPVLGPALGCRASCRSFDRQSAPGENEGAVKTETRSCMRARRVIKLPRPGPARQKAGLNNQVLRDSPIRPAALAGKVRSAERASRRAYASHQVSTMPAAATRA